MVAVAGHARRAHQRGRHRHPIDRARLLRAPPIGAVPVFFVAMPWLVEVVFGQEFVPAVDAARIVLLAAAIQFAIGWTKSLPVTVGRPRLRILTHGLETIVAIPLVAVLGAEWGATGAAVAVLASTLVFAAAWAVVLARLHAEIGDDPTRLVGETTL